VKNKKEVEVLKGSRLDNLAIGLVAALFLSLDDKKEIKTLIEVRRGKKKLEKVEVTFTPVLPLKIRRGDE
jgi:hypothetical protein